MHGASVQHFTANKDPFSRENVVAKSKWRCSQLKVRVPAVRQVCLTNCCTNKCRGIALKSVSRQFLTSLPIMDVVLFCVTQALLFVAGMFDSTLSCAKTASFLLISSICTCFLSIVRPFWWIKHSRSCREKDGMAQKWERARRGASCFKQGL